MATGYYFNFIVSVLDLMNEYEEFKRNHSVMDNAPIYKHEGTIILWQSNYKNSNTNPKEY